MGSPQFQKSRFQECKSRSLSCSFLQKLAFDLLIPAFLLTDRIASDLANPFLDLATYFSAPPLVSSSFICHLLADSDVKRLVGSGVQNGCLVSAGTDSTGVLFDGIQEPVAAAFSLRLDHR
jgi:hypothetical protein